MKKCEKCAKIATAFVANPDINNNCWQYLCDEHTNELFSTYHIPIDDYYNNQPNGIDWDEHLYEKDWFDESSFSSMEARYKKP